MRTSAAGVDIYTADDEIGKTITIGSYGPQRISIGDEVVAQSNSPAILIHPGKLHWGRNTVSWASPIRFYMTFSPVGRGDYVRHEVYAGKWDSAAAWFIKDGAEWKLASFSSGPCEGPRLGNSEYANWIHDQIWLMSGIEPVATAAKNPSPTVDSSATDYPVLLLTWQPGDKAVKVRSTQPNNWDVVKATRIFGGAVFLRGGGPTAASGTAAEAPTSPMTDTLTLTT